MFSVLQVFYYEDSLTVAKEATLNIHEHRCFQVFFFKNGNARPKSISVLLKLITFFGVFEVGSCCIVQAVLELPV